MRTLKALTLITFLLAGLTATLLGAAPVQAARTKAKPQQLADDQQYLDQKMLRQSFTRYVCAQLKKSQADVTLTEFKVVGADPIPLGNVSIKIYQKKNASLEGYVRAVAMVAVDGAVAAKVKLYGWLDVFESVVITRRKIKKGTLIGRDDVYLERKNISHLSPDVATQLDKVVGLMAKHTLKAGAPIKGFMVKKAPVVKRGELVTILAQSGALRISVPGKILQTGYAGEMVQVENTMSRKRIYARVINGSLVQVQF